LIHCGGVADAGWMSRVHASTDFCISGIDIVSGISEGLKMGCVTLRELTVAGDVSGDNW